MGHFKFQDLSAWFLCVRAGAIFRIRVEIIKWANEISGFKWLVVLVFWILWFLQGGLVQTLYVSNL